jgi:LacI family transcriptional regulator
MARPTLRDVARECGVSLATVSKALNPHADRCDLSPATRAKVAAAAQALGFAPSASHGRRTRRLWRNIGLVWGRFAPFTSGVYEGVLDAIAERLLERGWRLLYTPVPERAAWRAMQMAHRLDGVLAVSHVPRSVLTDFVTERYPAVLLNLRTDLALPQFLPDEAGAAEALARHFANLGHRRVLYLGHHGDGVGHFSETERPEGLVRVGKAARMQVDLLPGSALADVVGRCRAGTTGVICYDWNDIPKVVGALGEVGLGVPKAVSVACCADVRWFQFLTPSVTAVEIPMRSLALQALDRLLARIDEDTGAGAETVLQPPLLRERASTAAAPR